jgi:hypothetical protein
MLQQVQSQVINWDTSGVNNMEGMFSSAAAFNQPLNWNTSAVTNMFRMFRGATVHLIKT